MCVADCAGGWSSPQRGRCPLVVVVVGRRRRRGSARQTASGPSLRSGVAVPLVIVGGACDRPRRWVVPSPPLPWSLLRAPMAPRQGTLIAVLSSLGRTHFGVGVARKSSSLRRRRRGCARQAAGGWPRLCSGVAVPLVVAVVVLGGARNRLRGWVVPSPPLPWSSQLPQLIQRGWRVEVVLTACLHIVPDQAKPSTDRCDGCESRLGRVRHHVIFGRAAT